MIKKNQSFGELSFLTGDKRSSTAQADDFCRIYKINREKYINIIKNNEKDFENFQMLKDNIIFKR